MFRHMFQRPSIPLLVLLTLGAALLPWGPAAPRAQMNPRMLSVVDTRVLDVPFDRIDWPVFSPSGTSIAFSATAPDGRRHIFAIPGDGGEARQITSGAGDDWSPRFSVDGQKLAFVSNRSGNRDIWIVPAAGGELRAVTNDPAEDLDPEWSPDGQRLVFASRRGGPLLLYQALVSSLQVFPLSDGSGEDRRPAWSPDGQWIAFQSTRDGRRHVYLIPADGGEARRLSQDNTQEESWPAWFPDSRSLVAQMGPPGAVTRLWTFSTDPKSRPMMLIIPPTPGRPGQQGAPPPSLSRDGQRLVMAGGGEAAIEVVAVSGGGPTTVASGGGRLRHPSWAKDGRRLLVTGDLSGSWDLWMVGASSGRTTRLTDDDDREMDPTWSLVTGDILFALESPGGSVLHLFEPETRRAIRVGSGAPGARETEPAWSPDARSMAFVSERDGNRDIWVGPIGGGVPRRLTTQPGSETHPTWSPDGQWIAYASDQGHGSEIWKIPTAGGQPVRVTTLKEGVLGDTQPDWSPSNHWIAFTRALASGGSDIYMISPEGKDLFPIRRGSGARIMDAAWSPTGDRLAYSFSRPDKLLVLELGMPRQPQGPAAGAKGTPQSSPDPRQKAKAGRRPPGQPQEGQEGQEPPSEGNPPDDDGQPPPQDPNTPD